MTGENQAALLKELTDILIALDEAMIVSTADAQGRITSVNDNFCRSSKYSRQELLGKDHRILNSGHHSREYMAELWRAVSQGQVWHGELKNRAKDGSFYWVEATIVPSLGDDGKPAQYFSILTEVTNRKIAEVALERKNKELEIAARIDRISARVLMALNQRDEAAQPGADVLRVLADEAGYRPLAFYEYDEWHGTLVLSASLGLTSATQGQTFKSGEGLVGEAAALRRPLFVDATPGAPFALDTGVGILRAESFFALPVIHGDVLLGAIAGASHVPLIERERSWLTQVAAQVAVGLFALRHYRQLREVSAKLNERSRQIEAQNRELAYANRLKSEFLANMSHELRTPLTAIIGFSEVLFDGLAGDLPPMHREYIGEISKAGRNLLSLINDVLDLSRIDAGAMELEIDTVELTPLIDGVITVMKGRAMKGRVAMSREIAADADRIQADPKKVRQIVANLMSNAVKFTPAGGSVRVEVRACDTEVEIAVTDTGIGIAPADRARLFRPFEQLDGGIDRKYEGTGLGLAMVKSLVELHGGTFGVESEPGQGSRFWVRLPRVHTAARSSRPLFAASKNPGAQMPTPRVLVIDDDPAALTLARQWLSKEGYSVELARDCEQADVALGKQLPDVILLDVLFTHGPGGWEYLEKLKRTPALAAVPVIVVSIVPELGRALTLGAAEVLQKPVAGPELVRAVQTVVPRRGIEGPAPRILVVDDESTTLEFVSARLERAGMLVTRAYDGAEALRILKEGGHAAIVLDLMLPDMSGLELLRQARAAPALAGLPAIILTAKELKAEERAQLLESASAVLSKGGWNERSFVDRVWQAVQASPRPSA